MNLPLSIIHTPPSLKVKDRVGGKLIYKLNWPYCKNDATVLAYYSDINKGVCLSRDCKGCIPRVIIGNIIPIHFESEGNVKVHIAWSNDGCKASECTVCIVPLATKSITEGCVIRRKRLAAVHDGSVEAITRFYYLVESIASGFWLRGQLSTPYYINKNNIMIVRTVSESNAFPSG